MRLIQKEEGYNLGVEVFDTKIDDVIELAQNLRKEDREEILASSGKEPFEALLAGYLYCHYCKSIMEGDSCIGMFGVGHIDNGVGKVWFLMSNKLLQKYKIKFIRESKKWLAEMHQSYPLLFNYVHEKNEVHVRWLKWMGFTFINRHKAFGAGREPFLQFIKVQ